MANQTAVTAVAIVNKLFTTVANDSFIGICLQNIEAATDGYKNWTDIQLVDAVGNRQTDLTNLTWGITIQSCRQYCNTGKLPFDYGTFSNSMTNYLLPWLALTAQLPYETGDPWSNVMAFCMAVGSPALITYSLTLTILNRSWARSYFRELKLKSMLDVVRKRAPDYDKRVSAEQFLVQEAQQVPLRCSQERGWLASLIVLPKNIAWWERLESRLKGTRRGFSPSLIAQMGLAIIAWLLTVIAAFIALLGDPGTALQISSSSLYIWLVPVIIGWILVGTQISDHSIEDALRAHPAHRARDSPPDVMTTAEPDSDDNQHNYSEKSEQKGIEVRGGLSPQSHNLSGNLNGTPPAMTQFTQDNDELNIPNWAGFDVEGDERRKGPTYNYSRLFTWWQVVNTIGRATNLTLDKMAAGQVCEPQPLGRRGAEWRYTHNRILAYREAVSEYCGLNVTGSCKQYPHWNELPAEVYRRIIAAAGMAILIQWGTAGNSIMTAYLTPTTGLGCRSGSYLLYAATSTIAWLLLVAGSLCSHQAMLQYQDHILRHPRAGFRRPSIPRTEDAREYDRPMTHTIVCAAAVIFRVAGKGLCIFNTIWLLLTSVMEFVGGFDNCWCEGVVASRGDSGYVVLFKTAYDLAESAAPYWGGGLAMTILVVILSVVFFSMGTWNPDID